MTHDEVSPIFDTAGLVEQFLGAGEDRSEAFLAISGTLRQLLKTQQFEKAAEVIRQIAVPDLDYTSIQSLLRYFHQCRDRCKPCGHKTKLAVLSSFTSQPLVEMIRLFMFAADIEVEVYEADYGVFRQEIIDPSSNLYSFRPHTLFIATSWRDLAHVPNVGDSVDRVQSLVAEEQAEWSKLWQTAYQRLGCQIIQNNFEHPPTRALGNHEERHPGSLGSFITRINESFQASAPSSVTIHDVDGLSSWIGRRSWGDERYFHHSKLPCAPEHLVQYAHSMASLLWAQAGLSKKCLVLDLDNTLWGGVIGDDGIGGIRLGQGSAEGEGFLAFQRYVRKLQERGVILAVCSKNTDHIARAVFTDHPEMALKLENISCFRANWEDKAANIRAIAEQLNIGLRSLIFLDDNPAERAIVRRLVPEVAVPEVSGDPLDFIAALENHRYFQVVLLGQEDLQRTEFYRGNAERQLVSSSTGSVEEFLQSLKMVATVQPVTPATLERSAQLINKSNQFNLTTVRRSAGELMAIAGDPKWVTRTVSLKDRFGDNGLISVLIARIDADTLDIDTWLMSCRVLKRNVEQLLLNHLCRLARDRGLRRLRGQYMPTPKNELVADHYSKLGFEQVSRDTDGHCTYVLDLDRDFLLPTFIEENGSI